MAAFFTGRAPQKFQRKNSSQGESVSCRTNPLTEFTDGELYSRYRFGRNGIFYITELIREEIDSPTARSRAIPAEIKL